MPTSEFIATLKTGLVAELEKVFAPLKLSDLATVADSIEYFLENYISTTIADNCSLFIPDVQKRSSHLFASNGIEFEVAVVKHLVRSEVLQIAFIRRDVRKRPGRLKTVTDKVVGQGRFSRIQILYSPGIPLNLELITETSISILETGYKWLGEAVINVVSDVEISMSKNLYSFIRTVFKRPELLTHFWLASVSRGQCIYLFDEDSAANALAIASQKASNLGVSPLSLASEILTCFVPYELIAAREAVSSGKCLDIDLRHSKYIGGDSLLATAEIVMYGSEGISIFPIVRQGQAYLVAVFPTHSRESIEGELVRYQEEITRRFRFFQSRLEQTMESLRGVSRSWSYGKVGELVGGFAKSFLEP